MHWRQCAGSSSHLCCSPGLPASLQAAALVAGFTQAGFRPSSARLEGCESGAGRPCNEAEQGDWGVPGTPSTCFAPSDCVMVSDGRLEATRRPGLRSEEKYQRHGGDAAMAMWARRVVTQGIWPIHYVLECVAPSESGEEARSAPRPMAFSPQRPDNVWTMLRDAGR